MSVLLAAIAVVALGMLAWCGSIVLRAGRQHHYIGALGALAAMPVCGWIIYASVRESIELEQYGGRYTAGLPSREWAAFFIWAFIVPVVWWARRGSPPPKHPSCPRCRYDLTGLGPKCPECGHEADGERDLFKRRRRRWAYAFALLLPLLGYAFIATPRILKGGPLGAMPTTTLILGLEWWPEEWVLGPGTRAWTGATLMERHRESAMWSWQHSLLDWRCRRIATHSSSAFTVQRAMNLVSDRELQESVRMRARTHLDEPDPQAWAIWASMIAHWQDPARTFASMPSPDVQAIVRKRLTDRDANVRGAAALLAGGNWTDHLTENDVGVLLAMLAKPRRSPDMHFSAWALAQWSARDAGVLDRVLAAARGSDPATRAGCVRVMSTLASELSMVGVPSATRASALEVVRGAVKDPDATVASEGVLALAIAQGWSPLSEADMVAVLEEVLSRPNGYSILSLTVSSTRGTSPYFSFTMRCREIMVRIAESAPDPAARIWAAGEMASAVQNHFDDYAPFFGRLRTLLNDAVTPAEVRKQLEPIRQKFEVTAPTTKEINGNP